MLLAVVDMQHSLHVLIMPVNRAADHLCFFFVRFPLSQHSLAIAYVYFFTTFTQTNYTRVSDDCTRVSHKTNSSACRNSTVSPKLSCVTSSSRWAWVRGPLTLNSWSETTVTHKIAFLGISMHCFQQKILPACEECCSWCMCKVCSSLGQKWGNERAITGSNIILTCPFCSEGLKAKRIQSALVSHHPELFECKFVCWPPPRQFSKGG